MKPVIVMIMIFLSLLVSACSVPATRTEITFANRLAEEGLWKEARYRWEKQLAENPDSPALLNNMAVAMEQLGDREKAEEYYRKALKRAPKNTMIQRNFEEFMHPESKRKEKTDEKPQKPPRGTGAHR